MCCQSKYLSQIHILTLCIKISCLLCDVSPSLYGNTLQAELAPMQDDEDVKRLREENGRANGHFQVYGVKAPPAHGNGTLLSYRLGNHTGSCTTCNASHHAQHSEGLTLMSCYPKGCWQHVKQPH